MHRNPRRHALVAAALALALPACGGESAMVTPTPRATIDQTRLPVGDAFFTATAPRVGYAYLCSLTGRNNGFGRKGPWFNSDSTTFDKTKRLAVQGSVSWISTFAAQLANGVRRITGNGLPSHRTGTFPVESDTAA
jgi:hypothetical protein